MDLQLVKRVLIFYGKRRNLFFYWQLVVLIVILYTGLIVYLLKLIREKVLKVLGALISVAEAVSDSVETIGIVYRDLKDFVG